MSKKNKKRSHNSTKRTRKLASIFTKGLAISQVGEGKCEMVCMKKYKKYLASESIVRQFTNFTHKYNVLIICFCQNGDERYMKTEQIQLASPYYHCDLLEFLRKQHEELAGSCNQSHLVNLGWLASTEPIEFDMEKTTELFESFNAWD